MPLQDSAAAHGGHPPPPPKPEAKLISLLLKITIMILLTTLFFVFLGLATALLLIHLSVASTLHRRRRRHRHSQFTDSSSGFSHSDLKKLLQFRFSNWVDPQSQIDCAICLDAFGNGDWCRKLSNCGHVYHRKCIDSWLVRVPVCPLCRTCVRLEKEEDPIDRVSSISYEILYAL